MQKIVKKKKLKDFGFSQRESQISAVFENVMRTLCKEYA